MSDYTHPDFGTLKGESTTGEHRFNGKLQIAGVGTAQVYITGDGARPIGEIVDAAAGSLQIYQEREQEFRKAMLDSVVTSDLMRLIHSDLDNSITREEVRNGFSILSISFHVTASYSEALPSGYTQITYEDVEGFLGYDVRVVGDLSFEKFIIEEGV